MNHSDMNALLTQDGIRNIEILRSPKGIIEQLSFAFGPHHFVQVDNVSGKVTLTLGVTHHGVTFDASDVGGEWEQAWTALETGRTGKRP